MEHRDKSTYRHGLFEFEIRRSSALFSTDTNKVASSSLYSEDLPIFNKYTQHPRVSSVCFQKPHTSHVFPRETSTFSVYSESITDHVIQLDILVPGPEPPPNGGLVAWTQVLMAHLLVFNGFGYVSSFGLFQAYYETTLDRSKSDISWVGSFQMFLLFFIGTLSGRAMDAGYFRTLIVAGCSMQLLGVFATSFCTAYWQLFLAQGVVQGLGNGLLFTPLVTLVSTYFTTKRALALGFAACGAPTGGIAFPLVNAPTNISRRSSLDGRRKANEPVWIQIARQLTSSIGFPWTVRVMGFVMLLNTLLIITFVKPRLAPRPKGPLVEITAFRERAYSLFAIGIFLALLGLYFAYYYVSTHIRSAYRPIKIRC